LHPSCPCPLGGPGSKAFPRRPRAWKASFQTHPLVVFSSLRSLTGGGRQPTRTWPGTSPGVPSPSALDGSEQLVAPEIPSSDLPARTVFHLITPCTPPRSRPALFRAGGALGVAPCRALIIPEIRTPLGAGYPPVVALTARGVSPAGTRPFGRPRRLAETEDVGSLHRDRPCGRAWEAGALVFRGATSEAVELESPEGDSARVATCPGEREPVARSAPRTTAEVPVEGRRAEARRGSPRAAEPMASRPCDAVRCLAPSLAARGRCSLRSRTAVRHRVRRCRQVRSLTGVSRSKVQEEVRPPPPWLNDPWLVPGQGYEERAGKADYRVLLPPGSRSCSSGFGRSASRCSPGLSPLQGFPPRRRGVAFTTQPLASVDPVAPEGGFEICSTGVRRHRDWLVSFGDCRPS
jgi:hypothetical protein